MDIQELVRFVHERETALIGFDWRPFGSIAVLRFLDGTSGSFLLRLVGTHLVVTRQSLLGDWNRLPLGEEHWEDWLVHYFDVQNSGEFLERFLNQTLGFPSHVIIYSSNGLRQDKPAFLRPMHVTVVTGGGDLDIVCESLHLLSVD